MTSALLPIRHTPAVIGPDRGLYETVEWLADGSEPFRALATGVDVEQVNTGLDEQFGVWGENWCANPDALESDKIKDRLNREYANFTSLPVYGYDANQCGDMTEEARREVRQRALNSLTLNEQRAVETSTAIRMLAGVPEPPNYRANFFDAVSFLEGELAKKGITGYIHLGAQWAAHAARYMLNDNGRSPMGHTWVFGGGYVETLGWNLIATTRPIGWRSSVSLREAYKYELNQYVAVAERTVLVAYEAVLASVNID